MTISKAQTKATTKYKKKTYKRVPLELRFEEYEQLKVAADSQQETINGYIKAAIKRRIESNT